MVFCQVNIISVLQLEPKNLFFPIIFCCQDFNVFLSVKYTDSSLIFFYNITYKSRAFFCIKLSIIFGARVRLTSRVSVLGIFQLLSDGINIAVPLRRPGNAISPMQSSCKPLGAIGGSCLAYQHIHHLFIKTLGISRTGKITMLLSPMPPTAGNAMSYLFDTSFSASNHLSIFIKKQFVAFISQRNTSFSKIFLGQNICGHLAPRWRNFHILHLKDGSPIWIFNN